MFCMTNNISNDRITRTCAIFLGRMQKTASNRSLIEPSMIGVILSIPASLRSSGGNSRRIGQQDWCVLRDVILHLTILTIFSVPVRNS